MVKQGSGWLIGLCLLVGAGICAALSAVALSTFAADSPASPSAPKSRLVDAKQPLVSDDIQPADKTSENSSEKSAAESVGNSPRNSPDKSDKPSARSDAPLYNLKYKLRVGEVLRTEVVHRATIENTIKESSQTAEMRTKSIKSWKVTDAAPGRITFVHMVESVDMWQRTQGRAEVTYNSLTDEKAPSGYENVAAAVGIPLTEITMDERGTVLKREEKHPQPDMQNPQITIPLPKEPVALGYSWTAPLDVDVLLTGGQTRRIHTQQRFTLEKVVDSVATIQVETQVLTPIHDATIEAQLIQRMSSGALQFDLNSGRVIGQQLDLDRHVIGCAGPGSSMHYLMRFTEKPLPASEAKTAKKPTTKRK